MKKILSMVLAVVLVFACVGCAGKTAESKELTPEKLKGTWEVTFNMQEMMDAMGETGIVGDANAEYMKDFKTEAVLKAYLVFDGAETVEVMVDVDEFLTATKSLIGDMFDFLKNGAIYDMMADEGMDEETFNEMLSESGMDVASYIDAMKAMFEGMLTKEALIESEDYEVKGNYLVMNTTTYKLDGTKLYIDEDKYVEVTYNGIDMIFVKLEAGEDEDLASIENVLPLTVKRVSDKVSY